MAQIKLILLDFDGTLVDTRDANAYAPIIANTPNISIIERPDSCFICIASICYLVFIILS